MKMTSKHTPFKQGEDKEEIKMKYYLIQNTGEIIKGVIIDESAKKDFIKLMDWNEYDWKIHTKLKQDE